MINKLSPVPGVRPGKFLLGTLILLFVTVSTSLQAEQVSVTYTFEPPVVQTVSLDGQSFDRLVLPDAPGFGNPGEPLLPARGARILLPPDAEVTSIEIEKGEPVLIGSGYQVEPAMRPYPLSSDPSTIQPTEPDAAIYALSEPYPKEVHKSIGTQIFRGYQILTVRLQPVQFVPTSGELQYYPKMTVKVNTVPSGKAETLYRGLPEDELEAVRRVDNPEALVAYQSIAKSGSKSFDLLILTTPELAASFQPLKEYHDSTGMPTEIRTTTDAGGSDHTTIRTYITNVYNTDGISYVLLGADDDLMPSVDLYVESWPGGSVEYAVPGDLYFGCLNYTWNNDGDSRWGEPDDGRGFGPVDLLAEVYVGRATVGNTVEADRFVNKTIAYLTSTSPALSNVLLSGEHLGFGGVSEYAANSLEKLIDGAWHYGRGISPELYTIDELFDRDWSGNDWPFSELQARVNSGLNIISHFGHGNISSAMKTYSTYLPSAFTNDDLFFLYSQACLSGHFDGTDSWVEYLTIKGDHGAFSAVMNARYGWGTSNSTDGPSERFNLEFWDAMFDPSESMPELGRANQDSKEDNLYRIDESCMRWCYYELNLIGDPTVRLRGIGDCTDQDVDSVCDVVDNCPSVSNLWQQDADDDEIGDACDDCTDLDNDGYGDPGYANNTCADDNCPDMANPDQTDGDSDGFGDACDNCPADGNTEQTDGDNDGVGDVCDNCPGLTNLTQEDGDGDGVGDVCDICPGNYDPLQLDSDSDGKGDACDNCPGVQNADQADADGDGVGDACDDCTDTDGDGCGNPGFAASTCLTDNCPTRANPDQADTDGDGVGDACCCVGTVGNTDCDSGNSVDVGDLTTLINHLFINFDPLCCPGSGDTGNPKDGSVDVGDLTALIDHLFISFPPLPACN
ncbi:MAG: thrombospondin type 3 repeat-containing protein [candidate division Zixibacteria bacterium]|nr:thrombospondin type 3 repeat-containing protein [candidate division Zixibacteria bacterium]